MKAAQLIESIRDVFLHQPNYLMQKYVPEFYKGGELVGDYFNFITFELLQNLPPRIYHTVSPFDTVSQKAPEHALIFHDGKLELSMEFTELSAMRTGVMDALLLQTLGIEDMKQKRVIMYGTGRIARWSLRYLKEIYPDICQVDIVNSSGNADSFIEFASEIEIAAVLQNKPTLELYDVIILHTNAESAVLSPDDVTRIKKGAIITSYRTSSKVGELAAEFFDTEKHRVIVDWEQSLLVGELKTAQEKRLLQKNQVLSLVDVLQGNMLLDGNDFTVFRSMGTPMQDVAILKVMSNQTTSLP